VTNGLGTFMNLVSKISVKLTLHGSLNSLHGSLNSVQKIKIETSTN